MTNNPTEKALIARGFDSDTASRLRRSKQTIGSLKLATDDELAALGLSPTETALIRQGTRPPIPGEVLNKVLFSNRWACCVCRDANRPIIVHHLSKWSETRDHSARNLAVLCTLHHGEAHTRRELEQNLTSSLIADFKARWEAQVCAEDALAIQQGSQLQAENWFYFNHLRLFEIAQEIGVDVTSLPSYAGALESNVCDELGGIVKQAVAGSFMYADSDRRHLYFYVKEVFANLMDGLVIRNISDLLDRGILSDAILEGDIVFVQGIHQFSSFRPMPAGTQLSRGKRSANRVSVEYVFDLAEATSGSAWSLWLRGAQSVGSLVQVKRITRMNGKLSIIGTVLAIRSALEGLKKRSYHDSLLKSGIPQRREHDNF